ncbi:hypothetical protein WBJ53_13820 [Spirosoma sp. SC4-14]|uniref:hypothetical protein n=1 Tax=Spirosoma sp. SC4-14 TaxID=3128900 RepID=UPI0030CF977D
MNKDNESSGHFLNQARFRQMAIDNSATEYQIRQLDLQHRAEQIKYRAKLAELERHRADLYEHTNQTGLSDYEEGKRREKIKELTAKISAFEPPKPVNEELYQVQRQMLTMKLKETAHLNATLLIWQAQENRN